MRPPKRGVGVQKSTTFHSTPSPPITHTLGGTIPCRRLSQTLTTAISTSPPTSLQGSVTRLPVAFDTITQDDKKAKSKSVHPVSSIPTPTLSKKPRVSNDVRNDSRLQQEIIEEVCIRVFNQKPSRNYLDLYLHPDFLRQLQIQHPPRKLGFHLQPPLSNFPLSSYMSTFQHLDTVDDGPKVTGRRLFLRVDASGVHAEMVDAKRILASDRVCEAKLPDGAPYFDHAAWFIESTNHHRMSKYLFGTAICVYESENVSQKIIKARLGFVAWQDSTKIVYYLCQDKVAIDPKSKQPVPAYMLLEKTCMRSVFPQNQVMGGTFSGPYWLSHDTLVCSNRRFHLVYLNQIMGRSVLELQTEPDHITKLKMCINELDKGFQCARDGPALLIPRSWKEETFLSHPDYILVTRSPKGSGNVDTKRKTAHEYEGKHVYMKERSRFSRFVNFHGNISLEDHCSTMFVVPEVDVDSRKLGPRAWLHLPSKINSNNRAGTRTTHANIMWVPFVGKPKMYSQHSPGIQYQWFGGLTRTGLACLREQPCVVTCAVWDDFLEENSSLIIILPCIDPLNHPGGFRICVTDPSDQKERQFFEHLGSEIQQYPIEEGRWIEDDLIDGYPPIKMVSRKACSEVIDWTNTYTLPFPTLFRNSEWTRETDITTKEANNVLETYGTGFGDRDTAFHLGQTVYQGSRGSSGMHLSPSMGKGEARFHQYYRQKSYIAALQPSSEKFANRVVKSTQNFMSQLDPAMMSLLAHFKDDLLDKSIGRNHSCRCKILTQGVPQGRLNRSDGNDRNLSLGWSSTEHVDKTDLECQSVQDSINDHFRKWRPKPKTEENVMKEYLATFVKRFAISVPTCCGYEVVGTEDSEFGNTSSFEFLYYFVLTGLRLCVRIRPQYLNFFFAHTFSHSTSVCIAVKNGKVYRYDKKSFRFFTWGASGS